jgi:hypothetical protein
MYICKGWSGERRSLREFRDDEGTDEDIVQDLYLASADYETGVNRVES